MNVLKGLLVLQFVFLFIIPLSFAEIQLILPEKGFYNLGEKVAPTVSIKEDEANYGFFKLLISCEDYELQYYTIPLDLEAGSRTQLTVPGLPLSDTMDGKCRLRADLDATDGTRIDSQWSEYFVVTDELNIKVDDALEAKPGEDLLVSGEVRDYNNKLLSKADVEITFRGTKTEAEVSFGKFEHQIHLDSNAGAGDIPMSIKVMDEHGNYGDASINIKVLSIPTRIENTLENNVLMPGDRLKVGIILYDHSNNAMNGSVINVKISDPNEDVITEQDVESKGNIEFETDKNLLPGEYSLLSVFENIKRESSFTIEAVREIVMKQEGSLVNIENVGNVGYKDEVTIVLESDDKNYVINKKIDLEVGEKITIDLSKEVPQGTYDIILPQEVVEEEDLEVEQTNVIEDVQIDDNRNVVKKTTDSMSVITGAVVGAAGYVASRPLLATGILAFIIIGVVTHYSWGFIRNRAKGKEDETEHVFEDFKYEDKGENAGFEPKNEDNKPGN
mgnify:CR=1 FL=1|tara:strand:+ start:4242 stop:5747 length:1506 start_codon:yes stop_codon:yes gene_type:complete